MPKIPVYKRQVEMAAGQLGPRASSAAFEAPGLATASLAQSAGQIAFQFGMQEKKAEADRVYRESLSNYGQKADELIMNPKSKTVAGFNIEAGEFRTNALASIDSRTDLTNNQREDIKGSLGAVLDRKIAAGRANVFSRQQKDRLNETNKALQYLIDDAAANPAMRDLAMRDIQTIVQSAPDQGLALQMDMQDISLAIDKKGFELKILADEQSNNAAGLQATRENIFNSNLSRDEKSKLLKSSNESYNRVRSIVTDQYTEIVSGASGTRAELEVAANDLRQGKAATIVVNNKEIVIDPSSVGLLNKDARSIAKALDTRAKDIEDTISDSAIYSMTSKIYSASTSQEGFDAVVRDVGTARNLGATDDEIDNIITETAEQTVDGVMNTIDEGDLSDVGGLRRSLEIAENMLDQSIGGKLPVSRISGAIGEKAQNIRSRISKIRGQLNKAVQQEAQVRVGADAILDGSWYQIVSSLKPEIRDAAISKAIQGKTPTQIFNLLENNSLRLDEIAAIFPAALSRAKSPAFDKNRPEKMVMDTIELYRNIRLRPGVLSNHTTTEQRAFFDAVLDFEQSFGLAGSVEFVSNAAQITDAELSIRTSKLDASVKEIVGDVSQGGFLGFYATRPQNIPDIEMALKKRAKMFVKYGMDETKALKFASEDIKKTHQLVGNILLQRMENMPPDIEKKSEAAVNRYISLNPDTELEADELGIKPAIPGSPDLWNVVYQGGFPTGLQFTKEELEGLISREALAKTERILADHKRKQAARLNQLENSLVSPDDMMMPGQGNGKTLLQVLNFGETGEIPAMPVEDE